MIHKHKGAVWVEFLVVSSAVLLSMFYLIPMLAKYIDLRHATEQAARYGAWERTVWHGKVGVYDGSTEVKSSLEFQNEVNHRVLGDGLIYSKQSKASELSQFKLGTFHKYNNIPNGSYDGLVLKKNGGEYISLSESSVNQVAPSLGSKTIDTSLNVLDTFLEKKMPLNTKGYYTNTASINANIPTWIDSFKGGNFSSGKLAFSASNSILVDSWGAGGIKDNKEKVKAMRPFGVNTALDLELKAMQVSFYPYYWFSKEIRNKRLDLDKVDVEQLLEGEDPNVSTSHVEKF